MKPISTHLSLAIFVCSLSSAAFFGACAAQIDIAGPPGSDRFGTTVTVLPNGNFVVTDPNYDSRGIADVGAVHLYDGVTLARISTLTGSMANDQVGRGGITVLTDGNYVVCSTNWKGSRGAVTWRSGTTAVSGTVTEANSLVGSKANDQVGRPFRDPDDDQSGVIALSNGNYVVTSIFWNNSRGAVTWGNGTNGVSGVVSAANSLVGSAAFDQIGHASDEYDDDDDLPGVIALSNGDYVVISTLWNNGAIPNAGAVTWCSGTAGRVGAVSAANSLVGSVANDRVGLGGVTALNNGNYVVSSPYWYRPFGGRSVANAGAVTWGSGRDGVQGEVSASNSLVGGTADDFVGMGMFGSSGVTALANGNYVVRSPFWDLVVNTHTNVGAVTWGNGTSGVHGEISAANSLIANNAGDQVGSEGVTALNNGNYVVKSPNWDNGAATDAGAVTWGNGTTGVSGTTSSANSLVGSMANDRVGHYRVTALSNGNYVVGSVYWNNGAVTHAGAVTWGSGTSGVKGEVSVANSLVGSRDDDSVGGGGVTALANGNYVVSSTLWDNGAKLDAGAVTWCSGTTGRVGAVSAANSLVGSTTDDNVGLYPVTALNNGNYVVRSPNWNRPLGFLRTVVNAGAVTWGSGKKGVQGEISPANSFVGARADDLVGYAGVTPLNNGNYVVSSPYWDNGAATDAGAVTWGSGTGGEIGEPGVSGTVSAANSLVGSTANDFLGNFRDVTALNNGFYVVHSWRWDHGAMLDAGATTFGDGALGSRGPVTAAGSVLGTTTGGGSSMNFAYDYFNSRLLVGYPSGNRVSILPHTPVIVIAAIPESIHLRFSGVPGRTYTIERASTVSGPGSAINTQTVPLGNLIRLIEYTDTTPPPGQAFYRTVANP